ncbi:MAG: YidB family protein [Microvirga sp.]
MSRGFPSMTALLGLLAIAGYQNRDKLAEMLGGALPKGGSGGAPGQQPGQQGGLGGLLEQFKGAGVGGLLGGGLGELVDRFKQAGQGDVADSWVGTGPNKSVDPNDLEQALGPDVIADLSRRTGLSRDELLARLSRDLPRAVDQYTPDGRLPA